MGEGESSVRYDYVQGVATQMLLSMMTMALTKTTTMTISMPRARTMAATTTTMMLTSR